MSLQIEVSKKYPACFSQQALLFITAVLPLYRTDLVYNLVYNDSVFLPNKYQKVCLVSFWQYFKNAVFLLRFGGFLIKFLKNSWRIV